MKILNYFMVLIIILLLALMYGIHKDIQNIKQQLEIDNVETDNASDCLVFPCYTAKHRMWVSQKYLTKKKNIEEGF